MLLGSSMRSTVQRRLRTLEREFVTAPRRRLVVLRRSGDAHARESQESQQAYVNGDDAAGKPTGATHFCGRDGHVMQRGEGGPSSAGQRSA